MSLAANQSLVAINWGSTNFRAWRISGDEVVIDEIVAPRGVGTLDRAGMVAMIAAVAERWPLVDTIIATGMIGSNIGWSDVPYIACPVAVEDIAASLVPVTIGATTLLLAPGLACRRLADDRPDILRGEDVEIFGALALSGDGGCERLIVLPGTHTKWARVSGGRLVEFFTSMSGEIYDRLTTAGLLASVVEGEARPGAAFEEGLAVGFSGLGLGTALFGARAAVIRGALAKADAASYLRGALIGAEFADARRLVDLASDTRLTLVGNAALCRLYEAAAGHFSMTALIIDSHAAGIAGFLALDRARPAASI